MKKVLAVIVAYVAVNFIALLNYLDLLWLVLVPVFAFLWAIR